MIAKTLHGRLMYCGMVGQPQIVVGAEIEDGALSDADFRLLGPQQLALVLKQPR